jgi:hypothetical protein
MVAPSVRAGVPSPATHRVLQVGGIAGMLMYPVFALTVVLLTWAEWGFLHSIGWTVLHAHDVNYPSGLARGDLGVAQSLNFLVVLSVLCLLLARALRTQFVHRWSGLIATVALAAVVLSGVLSAFPTDLPGEAASWHGALHGLGFVVLLGGNLVVFVAAGLALRGAPEWGRYWVYSIVNALAMVLAFIVLAPLDQVAFYAVVTVMLSWYAVVGARIHRIAGAAPT